MDAPAVLARMTSPTYFSSCQNDPFPSRSGLVRVAFTVDWSGLR